MISESPKKYLCLKVDQVNLNKNGINYLPGSVIAKAPTWKNLPHAVPKSTLLPEYG